VITHHILVDFENIRPKVDALSALVDESVKITIFANAKQNLPLDMVKTLQPFGERVEYIEMSGSGKNALDFFIAFQIGYILRDNSDAKISIISGDTGFDPLINYLTATCLKSVERLDVPPNLAWPKVFSEPSATPGIVRQRVIIICATLHKLPSDCWPCNTIVAFADFIKTNLHDCDLQEQHIDGLINFMVRKELITKYDSDGCFVYHSGNIAAAAKGCFITKASANNLQVKPELASPMKEWFEKINDDLKKRGTSRPRKLATLESTIKALCKGELSAQQLKGVLNFMKKKKIITVSEGTKVIYNFGKEEPTK
jgi:hypothetical protein